MRSKMPLFFRMKSGAVILWSLLTAHGTAWAGRPLSDYDFSLRFPASNSR